MENNIKTLFEVAQRLFMVRPILDTSACNIGYSIHKVEVQSILLENYGGGFQERYVVWNDGTACRVSVRDHLFATLEQALAYIKEQEDKR